MNTLSQTDVEFFYDTYFTLLDFSNRRFHMDDKVDFFNDDSLDPDFCQEVGQRIWENPELIDELLSEGDFDEDTRNLLASWKNCVSGTFFVERHLKSGSFLIGSGDKVYQVLGLCEPLEDTLAFYPIPTIVDTTLLPFKDVIVTDGHYFVKPVFIGSGVKAGLKETYLSAKRENRIIRRLPDFQQENAAAPIKSNINLKAPKKKPAAKKSGKKPVFLYRLKVYPKGQGKSVYRIIEICGNATLKKLCETILNAFDFDDDHMYEFCMDNKMYSDYSYQSSPEWGEESTAIRLDKLRLVTRQKFTLHYDFGDDWMFPISVVKIEGVDSYHPPRVIKARGGVLQYPFYEDEEEWEEDEELSDEES